MANPPTLGGVTTAGSDAERAQARRDASGPREGTRRTGVLWAVLVIGVGLMLAPAVFQMFTRAPDGEAMIDDFRPFMTQQKVAEFRQFLRTIGRAARQAADDVDPVAAEKLGLGATAYRDQLSFLVDFEQQWPAIDGDMTDMLDRMERNLDSYAGVDALPPFSLFPWFFVVPGLLIAGAAGWTIARRRRGRDSRGAIVLLVVVGVGLVAAPVIFQMFGRAPGGGDMIDDFRSLMTREKVTTVQGYFITIGNGEAQLRNDALPAAALPAGTVPAVEQFSADWPNINSELSPMVGVMADNVDNFSAVDSLPPFALFPWFFVIPGVLVALLGVLVLRARRAPDLETS
jgi:hypothetical protein